MSFIDKLLGSTSEAQIKKLRPMLDRVNSFAPAMAALSDSELRQKTVEFRARYENGQTLDDLLPEAFAVVREAAKRTIGQYHFDEQVLGGIVLHQGRIAEMKTGEGKTLTETLPAYLNALSGHGVHIVTVNDYLAKRDAEWMGKIYKFLGMSVGCIVHDLESNDRRAAYACDITYGTNNEFGFDYLRDNMVVYREQMVQRELNYAIVDEVDSILIDEARTPLIISGAGEKSVDTYGIVDKFVRRNLVRGEDIKKQTKSELLMGEEQPESGDYMVDIKARTVALTASGNEKVERFFNIDSVADPANAEKLHYVQQAIKAHALFIRDVDYVVQNGQVLIVDTFTGRLMFGRRYSDGLHQALEAKEGVKVERENRTLATITFQNYFRMFKKLAGMTGTAKTEEMEFQSIYDLDVVEVPTHEKCIRNDANDIVYISERAKFAAVVQEIEAVHKTGRPILVGTISVEKSEMLADMLQKRGIKHVVLNAKQHEKEAEIVAQAGKLNAVTIATNMAGRGTDIMLGGNPEFLARKALREAGMEEELIEEATGVSETDDPEVLDAREKYAEAYAKYKKETDAEHDEVVYIGSPDKKQKTGGLYIIGTERHESRRIDNQLRGRAGRQGDPGATHFYVSVEDDLMRRFGGERMQELLTRLSPKDDVPIEAGILTKQIEGAQKRVESMHFESRKHVLQYDDVMNKQREIIYGERRRVLMGEDIHDSIESMIHEVVKDRLAIYCPEEAKAADWDIGNLVEELKKVTGEDYLDRIKDISDRRKLEKTVDECVDETYAKKEREINEAGAKDAAGRPVDMREAERNALITTVDTFWMDHIDAMDQLKQGIGLQSIGQRDPVVAYRNAGFDMFDEMVANIREYTVNKLFHIKLVPLERKQTAVPLKTSGDTKSKGVQVKKEIGRNAPCPCGSGKKYKNCCMNKQQEQPR